MAKVKNTYKVNSSAWKKWTNQGKDLFNEVYGAMTHTRSNQELFTHPDAPMVPGEHWNTIAYNAAWWAAQHVSRCEN